MNLSDLIVVGYILNVLIFIITIGIAMQIQREIGLQIVKRLHANASYKVSNWVFILYVIPYFPAISLAKTYIEYNKLKTDNIVETYERFINRKPTLFAKLFIKRIEEHSSNAL